MDTTTRLLRWVGSVLMGSGATLVIFAAMAGFLGPRWSPGAARDPLERLDLRMSRFTPEPPEPPRRELPRRPDFEPPPRTGLRLQESFDATFEAPTGWAAPAFELQGEEGFDGSAIRLVGLEPTYPMIARLRQVEGWVVVDFDVSTTGVPQNVRVVASKPEGVFDAAAVAAVQKWRYQPELVSGRPRSTQGHRVRIRFELD